MTTNLNTGIFGTQPYGVPNMASGVYNPNLMNTGSTTDFFNFGANPTTDFSTSLSNTAISGTPGGTDSFFGDFFSTSEGGMGWGMPALQAATGLAQSWLGFQQLGLAEDQLAFQQNAWQEQFDIQKQEYDRQVQERAQRDADAAAARSAVTG